MKKVAIIVILVIMASALFYKYSSKPSSNNLKQISVQTQNMEEGAQLPPEAKKSVSEADLGASIGYSAVCSKNIDSIKEDFAKIWDPAPDKNEKPMMMNKEDSSKISDMLASYGACVSLAHMDRSMCDGLPSKKVGGGIFFPRERCYFKHDELALSALSVGKYKDDKVCSDFISSHRIDGLPVEVDAFCLTVKKGIKSICKQVKGKIPPDAMEGCLRTFPPSMDSCSGDTDCISFFKVSEAFSSGKMDKCPSQYKEHCDAFVNSSESSCSMLRDKLVNTYCEIYSKAIKKATEEARKREEIEKAKLLDAQKQKEHEEKKRMEEEKAAQEKMKEKFKRMQEEDNKKIREMLNKVEVDQ